MAEEYREYRRSRYAINQREKKKSDFSKKLMRQFILSMIIFGIVCGFHFWGSDNSDQINSLLKNAFTYQVDTSEITQTIENLINEAKKNLSKEVTTDENTNKTEITQDI